MFFAGNGPCPASALEWQSSASGRQARHKVSDGRGQCGLCEQHLVKKVASLGGS